MGKKGIRKVRKIFNVLNEDEFNKLLNLSYKAKDVKDTSKLLSFKVSKSVYNSLKKKYLCLDEDEIMLDIYIILEKYRENILRTCNRGRRNYTTEEIKYHLDKNTGELYYCLSNKQVRDFYLYTDYYKNPEKFIEDIINNFLEYGERFRKWWYNNIIYCNIFKGSDVYRLLSQNTKKD